MPLEGFPDSRLPGWPGARVRVLASPALGAEFVWYQIDMPAGAAGAFEADDAVETFFYIQAGEGEFPNDHGADRALRPGSFGLIPPGKSTRLSAGSALSVIILRKRYEPAEGHPTGTAHFGQEANVAKQHWNDNADTLLQTLLPDDPAFDLAMNIFTFTPGHGLPIVETHVMEHGALILHGKGLYYLGDRWIEVETDDFIYMAPFCPQSFYATGPTAARYLYYKNVNREIAL